MSNLFDDDEPLRRPMPALTGGSASSVLRPVRKAVPPSETMRVRPLTLADCASDDDEVICVPPPASSKLPPAKPVAPVLSMEDLSHNTVHYKRGDFGCKTPLSTSAPARHAEGRRMLGFQRDEDIDEIEAEYGRPLYAVAQEVFFIHDVDTKRQRVHALFANGRREEVRFAEMRPAKPTEKKKYEEWKARPDTIPVAPLIREVKRPREDLVPTSSNEARSKEACHWVRPRLVVRYVNDKNLLLAKHVGEKFTVASCDARNEVEIIPYVEDGVSPQLEGAPMRVAEEDLDTVLPKKGKLGVVVAGEKKGVAAVLVDRVKGSGGDVVGVELQSVGSKEGGTRFTVLPPEFCAVATKR